MLDHYVMFRLKPNRRGELPEVVRRLEQLRHDVPTIRFSEVLPNGPRGPNSYDVLYHIRFDDDAGFRAYMTHPKHVPVQKYVESLVDGIADIDVVS